MLKSTPTIGEHLVRKVYKMTAPKKQPRKNYWLLVLVTLAAIIVLLSAGLQFTTVALVIAAVYAIAFTVVFSRARNRAS